jgi:hypothetical protein
MKNVHRAPGCDRNGDVPKRSLWAERIPAHDEIAGCRDLERQDPRYAITGRPRSKSANPANNLMAIRMSWSACAQTRALLTD